VQLNLHVRKGQLRVEVADCEKMLSEE